MCFLCFAIKSWRCSWFQCNNELMIMCTINTIEDYQKRFFFLRNALLKIMDLIIDVRPRLKTQHRYEYSAITKSRSADDYNTSARKTKFYHKTCYRTATLSLNLLDDKMTSFLSLTECSRFIKRGA